MRLLQILKNKFMAKQQETAGGQFYVWVKSERIGQVVEVDETKIENKWINFTDGTRCNKQLINEFLLPASTFEQAEMIAKDFGGITSRIEPEAATPVRPRRDVEPEAATPAKNTTSPPGKTKPIKSPVSIKIMPRTPIKPSVEMIEFASKKFTVCRNSIP